MSHPNAHISEKLVELGEGISIWRVHIDSLREQDVNARVMSKDVFNRLTKNIENDNRLEQLPFCTVTKRVDQNTGEEMLEFPIISGHHRTRAARKAGLLEIPIMVDETELTKGQIRAKQISHNALTGEDDKQILARMFAEIDLIEDKIASGLTDSDFDYKAVPVPVDEIRLDFDTEVVSIVFMPEGYLKFQLVLDALEADCDIYLSQIEEFSKFAELVTETSSRENVRNISGIMLKMLDIVEDYYKLTSPEGEESDWVPLTKVFGTARIPAELADKITKEIKSREIANQERWKWFEQ